MKTYYFSFVLLLGLNVAGQDKSQINSLINAFDINKANVYHKEVKIYNYLESIQTQEKKQDFAEQYLQYADEKKLTSDLIFASFLSGEVNYRSGNIADAAKYYHQVVLVSDRENNLDGKFLGYVGLFYLSLRNQNPDSIQYYREKSDSLMSKVGNYYFRAIYNRRLASYHIENEKYSDALDLLLKIDISPGLGESNTRCLALSNIGWIYEHLNYPEKAKIYYQRALKIAKRTKAVRQVKFYVLKLAHIELFNLGNPEKAIKSYVELLPHYSNTGSYLEGILYGTLGYAYTQTGQMKESWKYLDKSKNTLEGTKDSTFLCLPYTYLTHYYFKKGQFQKAIANGEKALEIIKKRKLFKARKLILLDKLSEAYVKVGNLKKAYTLLSELNGIKSELELKKNKIAFVESQYELKESREQLQIAQLNNKILNKNKIIYLTLLIALFSFLLFLLYQFINRQKTNKKLKELDSLKTSFFTNISHEFRTPLTLISSPIQEAMEETYLSKDTKNHLEIAANSTKRLLSLVDQLLDLSKIDSGALKLVLERNTPTQLIAAWGESFSYLAKKKNIGFNFEIDHRKTKTWFDKDALEKITINLLGNAIKYTPKNGKIILRAAMKNDQLYIEVKNTGKSLTEEHMNTIFNRFFQANVQDEGAGIGLSLTKELVELHKGTIEVRSAPEEWTCFKITLCTDRTKFKNATIKTTPTAFNSRQSIPPNSNDDLTNPGNKREELPILLIVEDNLDVRILLRDTFKNSYNIMSAATGEEGISIALKHIPDIIISDIMMPIKDGIELSKKLKEDERTSHIPIILLTAKAGDENELMGINAGADDYVTKPFNQKILKSKVKGLIALRKKLQSRYRQEVVLKPKDIAITSVDERFLAKVQKVLDEKLVESSFSVAAFSKAVHMSRMQLHRKLKALTGLTASEFVRSQRLKLAVRLLKQPNINVSEVSYSVGFNDHAYFTKCFKETYHCTPSEYIKKVEALP
ncbi:MAG: response regulator [Saonia sp.]